MLFSLVRMYEEIRSRAGSVGIEVYMDLASLVNRRAPGERRMRVISFLRGKESLM